MIEKHIQIRGVNGRAISVDFRYKESSKPLIPIIYVHGFKGFKDWGYSNQIANHFAEARFMYVKFNFSHNGVTQKSPMDFVDLEAFGQNNYWIEYNELGLVIDWLENADLNVNFDKLSVIGHSRGGGITLLRTAQDQRIHKLIAWASVSDFEQRFPKDFSDWKAKGVEYIYNARTEQMMPLYFQLYETYYEHQHQLDIKVQCKNIEQEVLVIHGTDDPIVGLDEAKEISQSISNSHLKIIQGSGHTFGAVHPIVDIEFPEDLKKVIGLSVEFLIR